MACWEALEKLRKERPLVQCITNFVSMDLMANVLLAAGASPAMVHAQEETQEFTAIANALCINVGTLTPHWISSMKSAALRANQLNKPWVLDPVAAGTTTFRTTSCLQLLHLKPAVVRGNASEILALSGASGSTKGVDSVHGTSDALEAAKALAKRYQCVVAVSGAVDLITDGHRTVAVNNGVAMLQKITATGCSVTALIAAFAAICTGESYVDAAAYALAVFGLAAEIGMARSNGPASLRLQLIDALHGLDEAALSTGFIYLGLSAMVKKEDTVTLISAEGFEFIIDRKAALVSNTLKNMLTSAGSFTETELGEVRFPEISSHILEKVCQYFYWSLQFASGKETEFHIEPEITLELMMAANYLHT